MTAVYDVEGYTYTKSYTQDDIPADQLPALCAVVTALVGLAAPWQARQVIATLGRVMPDEEAQESVEAVELSVEAVNEQGGRRVFTSRDYSEFTITGVSAVDFFKFFTTHSDE